MKLQEFQFHPHAIQVAGMPVQNVAVGRDGVTEIQLFEGVLIVARGTKVWFTHTSYGTGMPIDEVPPMPELAPDNGDGWALKDTPKEKRKVRSR